MCHPGDSQTQTPATSRPRWTSLYGAMVPPLLALAAVEATAPSQPARVLLRWTLALGTFVGMGLWVRANRAAFDLEDWCACAPHKMTIRVIESRRPVPAPARFEPLRSWAEEPVEPAVR